MLCSAYDGLLWIFQVVLDAALADLCDNSAGVAESIIEVRYTG